MSKVNLLLLLSFCAYLFVVIFVSCHHEVWRDEVRALSLSRQAGSLPDLLRLLKNEGHPALWYLILFAASKVTSAPIVLNIASIAIAVAAVVLLFRCSPFQWWQKVLLAFSVLPLFEYSVMCRNYGISMLLMFLFCALYPAWRDHPFRAALVLFLLANTNVHSAIAVIAILLCLVVEEFFFGAKLTAQVFVSRRLAPLCLALAGVAFAIGTVMPDGQSVVSDLGSLTFPEVLHRVGQFLAAPGYQFQEIFWPFGPLFIGIILLLAALPLLETPQLLVLYLATALGLGAFFSVVYAGALRHQGILWITLVAVFWLRPVAPKLELPAVRRLLEAEPAQRLCVIAVAALFLVPGVYRGVDFTYFDFRYKLSNVKSIVEFLQRDPQNRDAIVVAEPDYAMEAMPYYAGNRVFFPREGKFSSYAHFTRANAQTLSRSELLSEAGALRQRYHVPVYIAFGHFGLDREHGEDEAITRGELRANSSGTRPFSYGKFFTWNRADDPRLLQSVEKVAEFMDSSTENFELYRVR